MSIQTKHRVGKRDQRRLLTSSNQGLNEEAIHRAACKLFAEQGFSGTSMQDIGNALGLQRGSLYHHIESKDQLLVDILKSSVEGLLNGLTRVMADPGTPDEKLRLYILVTLEMMSNHQLEMVIWMAERRRMPQLLDRLGADGRRADALLMAIIEDGIAAGSWMPRDKELAYQTLRGGIVWFPHWYKADGRLSVSEIASSMHRWGVILLSS